MKELIVLLIVTFGFFSCRNEASGSKELNGSTTSLFGQDFDDSQSISVDELLSKLADVDSLEATVTGPVGAVCQSKGCWMDLLSSDGTELFVEFKDGAFTMPPDIVDRVAVVTGTAYVDRISVEEQINLAKEEGMSDEEIANIVEPKVEYSFIATGVKLK